MKLTRIEQPVDHRPFSPVWTTGLSHGNTQTPFLLLLLLSCPLPCTCLLLCLARCCAPTLKSRRNPVRRSAVGAPESHGAGGGGQAGMEGSVVTSGPVPDPRSLLPLIPTGRSESSPTSQVKVNQRNWTNRVICACVKAQRRTNFCSSRLADPSVSVNQRHLSVTSPPREGVDHSRLIVVPKVGSEVPPGSLEDSQVVLSGRMIVYAAGPYPGL